MNLDELVKKTIILPKTKFLIRRSRSKDEEILSTWERSSIYQKSLLNRTNGDFLIHDGPPYANGAVHIGHFVNRVLKDFLLRFYNSIGFNTNFKLAWDTYGLPIEFKVLKENKKKITSPLDLRKNCRIYALENIELQKDQLRKVGLLTDYNQHYSTQDFNYQSNELRVLAEISRKGLIYRGLRPVYWSWSNQTALAENEVEYFEKEDYSLFFKVSLKCSFFNYQEVKIIVWTTQPWTIPFNSFLAVTVEENYLLVKKDGEFVVVSEEFFREGGHFDSSSLVERSFKGREIVGVRYLAPYCKNESDQNYIIDGGKYVSIDSGTGIVHIAPPCGPEDFDLAKREKINVGSSLDEKGRLEEDFFVEELRGVFYQSASSWLIEDLHSKNLVFEERKIIHSYPHDWRNKTPLVYRTTEQWFIKLSPLKKK